MSIKKIVWVFGTVIAITAVAVWFLFNTKKSEINDFTQKNEEIEIILEENKDFVEEKRNFSEVKNLADFEKTEFIPTLEHKISKEKNSVYCVTLLYAWEEIRKKINKPLIISPNYDDLVLLNNSKSFINVLKSSEYSTSVTINGDLITAKAEFNKSLPFETKLNSYDNRLTFKGENVLSFGVMGVSSYNYSNSDYEKLKVVRIAYYKNDSNFIVKLLPKDKKHEIILFKTDKIFNSMAEMNDEILKLSEIGKKEIKNENLQWKYYIEEYDELVIPKINFNIETNYATLEGKEFETKKQPYRIETAYQRTAFMLDENGAEIESEVKYVLLCAEEEEVEKPKPKKMFFDKDFLILLKRTDAKTPYFGLWVTNTELMIKK